MIVVRSLVFNGLFFGGTAIVALLLLPTLFLPRGVLIAASRLWARWVLAMLRVIVGLRVEVRGREHIPEGAALVAAKHQSALDTIVLPLVLSDPACALKRELTQIPIYGWYLRKSRQIVIDRAGRARALRRLVREASAALAAGRPVVIFPQGTRVAPGVERRYLPGLDAVYMRLGVSVTPVAVNSGLFWGRRRFVKRPGAAVFQFLPPIPPGLPRTVFARRVQATIEDGSRSLASEAAVPGGRSEGRFGLPGRAR